MAALQLLVQLAPVIIALIQAVEKAFPNKGWGVFKLKLVIKIYQRIKDALKDGKMNADDTPVIEGIISDVVEEMNKKPESWVTMPKVEEVAAVAKKEGE